MRGVASLNVFGSSNTDARRQIHDMIGRDLSDPDADAKALRSDWEAIGNDMRKFIR